MMDFIRRYRPYIALLVLVVLAIGWWAGRGPETVYEQLDETLPDPWEKPRPVFGHTQSIDKPSGLAQSNDDEL